MKESQKGVPIVAPFGPGVSGDSLSKQVLDPLVRRRVELKKNALLLEEGSPFKFIYVVNVGSLKAYTISAHGQERIAAFYLPTDVIGLDNGPIETCLYNVRALEATQVSEIAFNDFFEFSAGHPAAQRYIYELMSAQSLNRSIVDPNASAEERIARFLLALSGRQAQRKCRPDLVNLSMSREDIGRYLGLAMETVSRCLSRFQKAGLISHTRREVQLNSLTSLRQVASGVDVKTAVAASGVYV